MKDKDIKIKVIQIDDIPEGIKEFIDRLAKSVDEVEPNFGKLDSMTNAKQIMRDAVEDFMACDVKPTDAFIAVAEVACLIALENFEPRDVSAKEAFTNVIGKVFDAMEKTAADRKENSAFRSFLNELLSKKGGK